MYTVYDRMYGNSPAKNTVYTPYIRMYVWFSPTLYMSGTGFEVRYLRVLIRYVRVYVCVFRSLCNQLNYCPLRAAASVPFPPARR